MNDSDVTHDAILALRHLERRHSNFVISHVKFD